MGTTKTYDEYISQCPEEVKSILLQIEEIIKATAPTASKTIKYGIPTFELNGNLVHFAAFKKHIGFYPTPSGVEAFKDKIKEYKFSKGSIQFPLDKPIPFDLIKDIVKFRTKENTA